LSKFIIFSLIWWLTGNPFIAIIVILVLLYLADRRFVGFLPSVTRPISLSRRLSKLKARLALSSFDSSLKLEVARIYMERRQYAKAVPLLEQIQERFDDSADVAYALGQCRLKLGALEEGERLILQATELNPRVGYGDPYLRLGEALAPVNKVAALAYLERFKQENSSSCEAYYRLGKLYAQLHQPEQSKQSFHEAVVLYRALPRYKRRSERKWALLAGLGI
jgi:tetratricopeptide (TPR) repeat protein